MPRTLTHVWMSFSDEAQQQPIVIRRGDKDVATVISMASYEHLRAIDVERFPALRPEQVRRPLRESKLLERVLQPAAERGGLGRVTWHRFRHIHSSLLNDLRVPVKIAQEQLGHASIQTTLNIYTHVVDASQRVAMQLTGHKTFRVRALQHRQRGRSAGRRGEARRARRAGTGRGSTTGSTARTSPSRRRKDVGILREIGGAARI